MLYSKSFIGTTSSITVHSSIVVQRENLREKEKRGHLYAKIALSKEVTDLNSKIKKSEIEFCNYSRHLFLLIDQVTF